jgi:hypothetical protein
MKNRIFLKNREESMKGQHHVNKNKEKNFMVGEGGEREITIKS